MMETARRSAFFSAEIEPWQIHGFGTMKAHHRGDFA